MQVALGLAEIRARGDLERELGATRRRRMLQLDDELSQLGRQERPVLVLRGEHQAVDLRVVIDRLRQIRGLESCMADPPRFDHGRPPCVHMDTAKKGAPFSGGIDLDQAGRWPRDHPPARPGVIVMCADVLSQPSTRRIAARELSETRVGRVPINLNAGNSGTFRASGRRISKNTTKQHCTVRRDSLSQGPRGGARPH